MKLKTIACLELNSIALGMYAADEMVKAASVELVFARTTCPGRYLILISGDTGAVQASLQSGIKAGADMVIDSFVIPSVHEEVIPALFGVCDFSKMRALGIIETCTSAAGVLAADAAAKAANIELLEVRFAAGLAGKAFVVLTGEVSAVQAGVDAAVKGIGQSGPILSHVVIPSPSEELKAQIFA